MNEALDLAGALFAALEAEDWKGAARLFNRAQVDEWYLQFLRTRPRAQDFRIDPELLMKHQPEMPRVVAEYEVEQLRKQHFSRSVSDELAGVSTWEEAEQLDPVEAYGRFLQHRDPREQFRRSTADLPAEIVAEVAQHQTGFRHVVLGEVSEADRLRHVLYRRYWAPDDTSGTLYVLSCGRVDEGWSVEVSTEWTMALSNYSYVAEFFEGGEAYEQDDAVALQPDSEQRPASHDAGVQPDRKR